MFSELLEEIKNGEPIMEKWDAINYLIRLKSFYDDKMGELLESNKDNKAFYTGLKTEYDLLMEKYSNLYKKWEEFSKCLDMGPEKFISMLDDLKENIKSKGNEIAQLREQLKTSELDAKRYRNDGIQDRVKLQEVTEELEKFKKFMDMPCKEVKGLIDNLKEMNNDKMDIIAKLEADLIAVNKDKEMKLAYYEKELESMTKMRDNWKADCEYSEKCFQAERDRRWELEEEVKQLKKQLMEPKEVDCPCYVKNKKEYETLKSISNGKEIFLRYWYDNIHNGYIRLGEYDGDFSNLAVIKFTENESWVYEKNTADGIFKITKYNNECIIEPLTHFKYDYAELRTCCHDKTQTITKFYLTVGFKKIYVDTLFLKLETWHYKVTKEGKNYIISRTDNIQKCLPTYKIDEDTLTVEVID